MINGNCLIGFYQGMFLNNILTFNHGGDENTNKIESFDDVREIQRQIKNSGNKLDNEADELTNGPAYIILSDPDGNAIMLD
jgi:hypothetical protein